MTDHDATRRKLLRFLLYAPVVGLPISCGKRGYVADALSPEASLKKLILVLGPWTVMEKAEAEEFAERFLASRVASGPYLPDSAELVQSLARRFSDTTVSIEEINLAKLPLGEREMLLSLARQMYSFTETRFLMCGQPPVGECQADATLHTRRPTA